MPRPKKEKPNREDGRYEVKIVVGKTLQGKLIRKSFYSTISKADAKRQADEWRINQKVAEQTGSVFVQKQYTFSEWAIKWLETYKHGQVKESTYQNTYKDKVDKYLIPYFGMSPLTDIRPIDIQAFYNLCAQKYSLSTNKKIRLCLNSIFETAITNDLCYKNPARGLSVQSDLLKKEKHIFSQEEADQVLDFAQHHPKGLSIVLLLSLGLRRSELLGLMWSDIDLQNRTIQIQRAVTPIHNRSTIVPPKTPTSVRLLPLTPELCNYLQPIAADSSPSCFVIGGKETFCSISNWVHHIFEPFCQDLSQNFPDLPVLTPHEYRHTCGTLLYRRTKNIYAVSKFLGHSDVVITTKIYVHNDVESLRADLSVSDF